MSVIYLDYNATTPLHPLVREAMLGALDEAFANPASAYPAGQTARAAVERARGQVAVSRDLAMAVGLLAATGALVAGGAFALERLTRAVAAGIARIGQAPRADLAPGDLTTAIASMGALLAATAGPVALSTAAAGALAAWAQTGFAVSPGALQPKWDRLSPAHGLQRLAPSRAGVDTVKAIAIGVILSVVAWRIGRELGPVSQAFAAAAPATAAAQGWQYALRLLWTSGFALLAAGGVDVAIQRWRLWSSLKMTRQELRDEARLTETNPETKARMRRIQRTMARRRMLQAVPRATVVITNPTHFAVALEYRREKASAPVVVAKGQDLMAARIRDIARRHGVPTFENPPLARALFKSCEPGDAIPAPLFSAVAEVLAYLIRIKQLVL